MNKRKSILVIDDDPDLLDSLKVVLEKEGYNVISALSGSTGLKQFMQNAPDFILCDIMMEDLSTGYDLVTKIREKDDKVPIYILSAIGQVTTDNIEMSDLRCDGCLQKPIDSDELLRIIKHELRA